MAVADRILVHTQPSVSLKTISIYDSESGKEIAVGKEPNSQNFGLETPVVRIGDYYLPSNSIVSMEIIEGDLIPKFHICFNDDKTLFTHSKFPIHDPTVSIYVKSSDRKSVV